MQAPVRVVSLGAQLAVADGPETDRAWQREENNWEICSNLTPESPEAREHFHFGCNNQGAEGRQPQQSTEVQKLQLSGGGHSPCAVAFGGRVQRGQLK